MKKFTKDPAVIAKLTREQYHVTQESGTERPWTGKYVDNKEVARLERYVTLN